MLPYEEVLWPKGPRSSQKAGFRYKISFLLLKLFMNTKFFSGKKSVPFSKTLPLLVESASQTNFVKNLLHKESFLP